METSADTEYLLSGTEALLAATLALMTGQAQARCGEARLLMIRKIMASLEALCNDCCLHPNFRAAVQHLHGHWCWLDAQLSGSAWERARAADQWPGPGRTLQ